MLIMISTSLTPRHLVLALFVSLILTTTTMTLWYIPIIATTFHTAISHVLPINPSSPNPSLHIPTSSPLHISIFSDLHFGEAQSTAWGPIQDTHTQTVITSILSHEHPHLAVLNGDLITGEDTSLHNSSRYLDRIVQPFVQRGVPWASTYGNHDSDVQLSRNAIFERERKYRLSLTRKMIDDVPSAGVTNYFIPVYQDRGGSEEQTPIMLLWFFDSRGGKAFQRTDPSTGEGIELSNWVDSSVVDWFVRTRTHLRRRYRRVVPSVAFVHIPVTAMLAFQDEGVDPNKEPGINDDVPLAAQGVGDGRDGSGGYASQDRPFLEALLGTEGLMAVFSG